MQQIKLGKSDLQLSAISLGTMSVRGGATKLNIDIIREAVDLGMTYFDTADLYERGLNEALVGRALQGVRSQVVLATKVGNQWNSDGTTWSWKASKPYILKTVESSLSRLKTDYIDLYQLHGGMIEDPIDEIIEAFELLQRAGKIRYYGLSSIRPNVIKAYAERSNITSVMMQYSLLDRRPESLFKTLSQQGISVIARGALAQGLLLDKPAQNYLQLRSSEVAHANRNVERLANKLGINKLTLILAYVLSNPVVATTVLGVRTLAQLHEVKESIVSFRKLTAEEKEILEQGLRALVYTDHLV
ncbi:aldo/keto reductase [Sphingobacterium psychroaquaticum]|uniref:Predicted oxidoreductase n=1 Tax=Sphingobacterium psychroaquaticum TaxID=561061 RepID=A0A1X7JMT1_9SPHI|nr:aldo/keto reductase [Sphingobacterium psychroaquaticum]SMG29259.1 Predicted oxidoreductase [Sphingobacterium psychroaquaticum]